MDLYHLGPVTWWESQCYYHALAQLGREGIIICYPTTPYVCLGLHDDYDQEIDQEYCRRNDLPVIRRETGGGVVYLDDNQLFYQLVLRKDNPRLPLQRQRYYSTFLHPLISVYRLFGVPAVIKPPADIAADNKKCSGNACGDIGDCVAYVGNILLDFDFRAMSKILRVPDQTFRNSFRQAMRENMTTLQDWTSNPVSRTKVTEALVHECTAQFGPLNQGRPDDVLRRTASEVRERLTSEEWLSLPGRRYLERKVKVSEGLFLLNQDVPELGRVMALVRDGVIEQAALLKSGASIPEPLVQYYGCQWQENLWTKVPLLTTRLNRRNEHASTAMAGSRRLFI